MNFPLKEMAETLHDEDTDPRREVPPPSPAYSAFEAEIRLLRQAYVENGKQIGSLMQQVASLAETVQTVHATLTTQIESVQKGVNDLRECLAPLHPSNFVSPDPSAA